MKEFRDRAGFLFKVRDMGVYVVFWEFCWFNMVGKQGESQGVVRGEVGDGYFGQQNMQDLGII